MLVKYALHRDEVVIDGVEDRELIDQVDAQAALEGRSGIAGEWKLDKAGTGIEDLMDQRKPGCLANGLLEVLRTSQHVIVGLIREDVVVQGYGLPPNR